MSINTGIGIVSELMHSLALYHLGDSISVFVTDSGVYYVLHCITKHILINAVLKFDTTAS